ncbi:glucosamine 6-phosphate N-acetyltransferase [Cryptococcus neoformans Tu401-1]|nr:glucosamine 6-phosphate N-acetyltransferase [Cryptococcus neoformans var. grubii Bt85]OXG15442.1 glucosamine 6-phosphate N-acetyltransferase [Cryptococcus neoformans var. grubii Tu401-1]OXM78078.1 glucosamine 6-phosphate N-acetyltransferase [Cryptococcus neoformans var. grubii Bt63]
MAYAYPSVEHLPEASSASLEIRPSKEPFRKNSDTSTDVFSEFKRKISEDEIYINFLQERVRLENDYIGGLQRLYDRTMAIDSLHDEDPPPKRSEKPTSRRAWSEVRDYTLREIQAREAMKGALEEDVIKELVKLKDLQVKIRNSLKQNVKLAEHMYEDHAKHQLPKLKKTYFQKSQVLEDHRRQENAIATQARLLSSPSPPSPTSTPLQEHPFSVATGAPYALPPAIISPLPSMGNPAASSASKVLTQEATSGMSVPSPNKDRENVMKFGNRLRAESGSGLEGRSRDVLNDIAAHGKKGFSAFMQRLGGDKDREREKDDLQITSHGVEGEGLQRRGTTGSANIKAQMAVRGAKAKREADEADRAYRMGIFHLESLRLRTEKLHSSAITRLEEFNDELNNKLRRAMVAYVDIMHSTAMTSAQATEVARIVIDTIDADHDMMLFRKRLLAATSNTTRTPVPYENFYVGPCRSLIFGVSLTDYDFARGDGNDHGSPPMIVEKCIAAIDARGLEAEGIYRVSGRHTGVQKMVQDIEKDETQFEFGEKDDVFSIASVLKQYLRELPEPVFNLPHAERVKYSKHRESHINSNFSAIRGRLRRLPPIHQTTFQSIIEHLGRVHGKCEMNKMGAKNLAVLFSSILFGQEQAPSDGNILMMNQEADTVLEDLITFSNLLFGRVESPKTSHILPSSSAFSNGASAEISAIDDPQPGSSRTKVKILQQETTSQRLIDHSAQINDKDQWATDEVDDDRPNKLQGTEIAQTFLKNSPSNKDLDLLFDAELLPTSMRENLPNDINVRPLASTDLLRQHFELLSNLRPSPALAPSLYQAIFTHFKSCPLTYYTVVMVDTKNDRLVASGTLIVERKHINGGGAAGHLEDIVVAEEMRGKKLGMTLVTGLRDLAVSLGCYKVILDCKEAKIPFYENCGFHKRSAGMAYYTPSGQETTHVSLCTESNQQSPLPYGPNDSLAPPVSIMGTVTPGTEVSITSQVNQNLDDPLSQPNDMSDDQKGILRIIPDGTAVSDEESPESPRTFTSASSEAGMGVTYDFPTAVDESVLPAWAAEGWGGKISHISDRRSSDKTEKTLPVSSTLEGGESCKK